MAVQGGTVSGAVAMMGHKNSTVNGQSTYFNQGKGQGWSVCLCAIECRCYRVN